jgi:hypothetical protein
VVPPRQTDAPFYMKAAREYFEHSIAKRPMPESYILLTAIYGRAIAADLAVRSRRRYAPRCPLASALRVSLSACALEEQLL